MSDEARTGVVLRVEADLVVYHNQFAREALRDAERYAYEAGVNCYVWHQPIGNTVALSHRCPDVIGGLPVVVRIQPCGTLYFITLVDERETKAGPAALALMQGVL